MWLIPIKHVVKLLVSCKILFLYLIDFIDHNTDDCPKGHWHCCYYYNCENGLFVTKVHLLRIEVIKWY